MLQNSLQKVTDFITQKCYKNYYKKVTDIIRFCKDSLQKWKHSPMMKIMNQSKN